MVLPKFLCVGAQKSGTTTLHDILIQHPDIYLPKNKETKFFVDDEKFSKGIAFYKKEFFSEWKGEKAIGEVDPDYMYFDYVPERIYKTLGKDIKLIFILRNPVDRAYSHYLMSKRRGYETEDFLRAIEMETKRITLSTFNKKVFSYIDRGYYAKQVKRFLNFFPIENMLFVVFESDFVKAREKTIKSLFSFLEVDFMVDTNLNIKSNPASTYRLKLLRDFVYKPNVVKKVGKVLLPNEQIRKKIILYLDKINKKSFNPLPLSMEIKRMILNKYFRKDIAELSVIINKDLSIWYPD